MKKWIMAIVCLMTMVAFTSCGTDYIVTANYDVCHPDGTATLTGKVKVNDSYGCIGVIAHSFGGTNYISVTKSDNPLLGKDAIKLIHIESTTAPIRLNNYHVEKAKKKKVTITNDGYAHLNF